MRIAYFTHSLASCWNHGNAHFQRGLLRELMLRGHTVSAYEPEDAWSVVNLAGTTARPVWSPGAKPIPSSAPAATETPLRSPRASAPSLI